MCHNHPEISYATSSGVDDHNPAYRQSWEIILQSLFKRTRLPFFAIPVGMVLASLGNVAHAADRTIILNYICSTYESARQVALEQSWENPASIPADCRTLFQEIFDLRVAEIQQIIEVVPIGDSRWIQIGRVCPSFIKTGYSAGITKQLFLF